MHKQTKDLKKRVLYSNQEAQRLQWIALIHDSKTIPQVKTQSVIQLNHMNRNGSLCRSRNRCLITGRGRGIYRFCRLSRIMIRELGSKGWIAGLRKSSW